MTGHHSYTRQLVDLATPYWDTEAELTRRFFASGPSKDVWIRYLKAAVYKELNPVIGYGPTDGFACGLHMEFARLVDGFDAVDDGMDRRAFITSGTDDREIHALHCAGGSAGRLARPTVAAQRRSATSRRRQAEQAAPYIRELRQCGRSGRNGTDRRRRNGDFPRGAKLTGGDFETKLAAAFKVIADDEDGHVDRAADDLKNIIKTESDFLAAKIALLKVSMQRLHIRNEMFSNVMSAAELNGYLTERGGEPIKI